MKILSIDPSIRNFAMVTADYTDGDFTIEDFTVVAPLRGNGYPLRTMTDLMKFRKVWQGMNEWSEGVDRICAELPTGSQSARAARYAGACTAIIATYTKPMCFVTPIDVKKALTGDRKATKQDMIAAAFEKHPEAPWKLRNGFPLMKEEHYADAIGVLYAARLKWAFEPEGTSDALFDAST